ncbi:3-isopropylmalate dehydrogenase [Clostridiaceae bacterium M8S5]|nr:3-isopropylmalate dehydrogenase [Clostridiaceae bacterium M8S5]
MNLNIALLPGDGIGPEITTEAVKVLNKIGKIYNHNFNFSEALIGGIAYDKKQSSLPIETLELCKNSDAVLLGAVGGPKWDDVDGDKRPEAGLLKIRKELNLFANIRPAYMYTALKDSCPLKDEIIKDGFNICIVRELTGGIYFGDKGKCNNMDGIEYAYDTEHYNTSEIIRIARIAFETARKRNKIVTSIDKQNVLETSRLWRKTVEYLAKEYPDITLKHMLVDNAAMQLICNPHQFDVVLTSNMFGDILSDEASVLTGSIGMLPSASLSDYNFGLYEPSHGSAPDIAGKNIANPLATILSASMMLKYSFGLIKEADCIETAVQKVLDKGYRTADIMSDGNTLVSTQEMGQLVIDNLV